MSEAQSYTVGEGESGQRLDKWLATASGESRARVQALLAGGAASYAGEPVSAPTRKVQEGETYQLVMPEPESAEPEAEDIPLDVVFEDAELLVVNKPAGMTVHPAPGSRSATLVNALLHHCHDLSGIGGVLRPGIVHRIDKDTSGLLVVAKTDRAHRGLAKQFAAHTVDRRYTAFTRATPKPRAARVESRIARSNANRKKMAVVRGTWGNMDAVERGKTAVTNYITVASYGQLPGAALGTGRFGQVECRLETGRTHQIRVHMAHMGCPLLGDPLYGRNRAYRNRTHPAEVAVAEALEVFKRQALHARTLGFVHPVTDEELSFESALPPDMAELESLLKELPEGDD